LGYLCKKYDFGVDDKKLIGVKTVVDLLKRIKIYMAGGVVL